MKKTKAYLGLVFTVIIGMVGLSGYSEGTHMMKWFGIELSQGGFVALLGVFLVLDIWALINAYKPDKTLDTALNKAQAVQAEGHGLESPCTVTIKRLPSVFGSAMGVRVFLNGTEQGVLRNRKSLTFSTLLAQNELTVHYNADQTTRSIRFTAPAGGHMGLTLKYTGAVLSLDASQSHAATL